MKKVLLIDSGSGGVNVLKECVRVCPYCDFLLYCDDLNLPYGSKTKEELTEITFENLEKIRKFFSFEIVVFACNTLTSVCIDECRKNFCDVVFIGVEPAVKSALKFFEEEEILVLATGATIKHNRLLQNSKFQLMEMKDLASKIDENIGELYKLKKVMEESLNNVMAKAVVLGCTHYSSIKDMLVSILPSKTPIFDSLEGVASRLKRVVGQGCFGFKVQIMTSGKGDALQRLLWKYFNE